MFSDAVRASLGRDSNKVRVGGGVGGGGGIVGHSKLSAPKPVKGEHAGLSIDFEVSPNDLALATVPGQDFDPRTRCFSEEELKPQPMIKKSRKQVGNEETDKVNGCRWFCCGHVSDSSSCSRSDDSSSVVHGFKKSSSKVGAEDEEKVN